MGECRHTAKHHAQVDIHVLEDSGQFQAEIRITCDCGHPFYFVGLPVGLDLNGAAVSADGREARLAILPEGSDPTPRPGLSGFTIKRGTNAN